MGGFQSSLSPMMNVMSAMSMSSIVSLTRNVPRGMVWSAMRLGAQSQDTLVAAKL